MTVATQQPVSIAASTNSGTNTSVPVTGSIEQNSAAQDLPLWVETKAADGKVLFSALCLKFLLRFRNIAFKV